MFLIEVYDRLFTIFFRVFSQSLSTLSVIEEFLSKRDVPFFPGRVTDPQKPSRWARNKSYFRESITSWPEKSADLSRPHHWFPREMTSENPAQKFHSDDASLPRSG